MVSSYLAILFPLLHIILTSIANFLGPSNINNTRGLFEDELDVGGDIETRYSGLFK